MTTIKVDREVLHQLARRARGDGDQRIEERSSTISILAVSALARQLVNATAVPGEPVIIEVESLCLKAM